MAAWYVKHLDFCVQRASDMPVVARFMADSSGAVTLEVYRNPVHAVPDYAAMEPVLLHVGGLAGNDVAAAADRLIAAGAVLVRGREFLGEDEVAMLRDPWGLAIQLVKGGLRMIG